MKDDTIEADLDFNPISKNLNMLMSPEKTPQKELKIKDDRQIGKQRSDDINPNRKRILKKRKGSFSSRIDSAAEEVKNVLKT